MHYEIHALDSCCLGDMDDDWIFDCLCAYSRDIEPMEVGHGDQYYRWLIECIAAYKGGLACPILVGDSCRKVVERWLINPQ